MKRRFSLEGLEWETQDSNVKTLQVWRLLVDAEANLKAVRHINDKLRRQHDQEKEVQIYVLRCYFFKDNFLGAMIDDVFFSSMFRKKRKKFKFYFLIRTN